MQCCSGSPSWRPACSPLRQFCPPSPSKESLSAYESRVVFATELLLIEVWGPEIKVGGTEYFLIFSKVTIPLHNFLPTLLFSNSQKQILHSTFGSINQISFATMLPGTMTYLYPFFCYEQISPDLYTNHSEKSISDSYLWVCVVCNWKGYIIQDSITQKIFFFFPQRWCGIIKIWKQVI